MRIEPFLVCRKDEGGVMTLSSLSSIPKLSYKELYGPEIDISYEDEEALLVKTEIEKICYNDRVFYRAVFFYYCTYNKEIVNCGRNRREWIEGCLIDSPIKGDDVSNIRVILQNYFKNRIGEKIGISGLVSLDYRYLYSNYISGKNDDIDVGPILVNSFNEQECLPVVQKSRNKCDPENNVVDKDLVRQITMQTVRDLLVGKEGLLKEQTERVAKSILTENFEESISKQINKGTKEFLANGCLKKQSLDISQLFISLKRVKKQVAINAIISVAIGAIVVLLVFLK